MKSLFSEPAALPTHLHHPGKDGLPKTITYLMYSIIFISYTNVTLSILLSQEIVGRRPFLVFFIGRPIMYNVFLICSLIAFLSAYSSLTIQDKPSVERFCSYIAVTSMLASLAVVLHAVVGFSHTIVSLT